MTNFLVDTHLPMVKGDEGALCASLFSIMIHYRENIKITLDKSLEDFNLEEIPYKKETMQFLHLVRKFFVIPQKIEFWDNYLKLEAVYNGCTYIVRYTWRGKRPNRHVMINAEIYDESGTLVNITQRGKKCK